MMYGDDLMDVAANGTDLDWYAATGACGGCGDDNCHEGPCTSEFCAKCPERQGQDQGWPV